MATRATIRVEGFNIAKLYKHWDGSPESTLPWLEEFNQKFTEDRGNDPSYKFAQLIRSSAFSQSKWDLDPSTSTGWSVIGLHEDAGASYEYRLMADGTVITTRLAV